VAREKYKTKPKKEGGNGEYIHEGWDCEAASTPPHTTRKERKKKGPNEKDTTAERRTEKRV